MSDAPEQKPPDQKPTQDLKSAIEDFKEFLSNLNAPGMSPEVCESSEKFAEAKRLQIQALASMYVQSRLLKAMRLEGLRDAAIDILMDKLKECSPVVVARVLENLSVVAQGDMASLLGRVSPDGRHDQSGVVNVSFTQQVANIGAAGEVGGSEVQANTMRTLKSLANVFDSLVSQARVDAKEKKILDVKPDKPVS